MSNVTKAAMDASRSGTTADPQPVICLRCLRRHDRAHSERGICQRCRQDTP